MKLDLSSSLLEKNGNNRNKKEENKTTSAQPIGVGVPKTGAPKSSGFGKEDLPKTHDQKNKRSSKRKDMPRSEYDQKIISIRRVTRVVAGGRRFSFSVALISGNRKGTVGVGIGKASDTSLAIEKATRSAKKQ